MPVKPTFRRATPLSDSHSNAVLPRLSHSLSPPPLHTPPYSMPPKPISRTYPPSHLAPSSPGIAYDPYNAAVSSPMNMPPPNPTHSAPTPSPSSYPLLTAASTSSLPVSTSPSYSASAPSSTAAQPYPGYSGSVMQSSAPSRPLYLTRCAVANEENGPLQVALSCGPPLSPAPSECVFHIARHCLGGELSQTVRNIVSIPPQTNFIMTMWSADNQQRIVEAHVPLSHYSTAQSITLSLFALCGQATVSPALTHSLGHTQSHSLTHSPSHSHSQLHSHPRSHSHTAGHSSVHSPPHAHSQSLPSAHTVTSSPHNLPQPLHHPIAVAHSHHAT